MLTGTTQDADADDPHLNALRGDATERQLPASTPSSKGAGVPLVNDQSGDVIVSSNRDSPRVALVSTGAEDPLANDPRGRGAT